MDSFNKVFADEKKFIISLINHYCRTVVAPNFVTSRNGQAHLPANESRAHFSMRKFNVNFGYHNNTVYVQCTFRNYEASSKISLCKCKNYKNILLIGKKEKQKNLFLSWALVRHFARVYVPLFLFVYSTLQLITSRTDKP